MTLFHPVTIGQLALSGNIFLAPVAGYTDRAFRALCIEQGAAFTYTELVSAEALVRGARNTDALLRAAPTEKKYAVQIFGGKPDTLARAVPLVLEKTHCACIDINCGCPVPKVVKTGAGAALTRDADALFHAVRATVIAADGRVPITVKIRSGWDAAHITWHNAAAAALSAGAAAITMHPRTRAQGYEGKADWSQLQKLVAFAAGRVPVFGSGDVFSPEDAARMISETGCDGVMFARGAMGNPFIFRQTKDFLETGKYRAPSTAERFAAAMQELNLLIADYGELRACREMRKRFCAYTKGMNGGAAFRAACVKAETKADYEAIIAQTGISY
ncbi:MAG: tRNA dihydrouridine synthase DusB [Treponema sp.]|nr:tRNA dihydrouridine synthase DusB [Treponema sp.]